VFPGNYDELAQAQQQALYDLEANAADNYPADDYGYPRYDEGGYDNRASKFPRHQNQAFGDYRDSRFDNPGPTSILMIYGVNIEKVDCEKLFNLFCCYGNVLKVTHCLRIRFIVF
jgi:hypothetical protein